MLHSKVCAALGDGLFLINIILLERHFNSISAVMRARAVPSPSKPTHRLGWVFTAYSSRGCAWLDRSKEESNRSTSSQARFKKATSRRPCVRVMMAALEKKPGICDLLLRKSGGQQAFGCSLPEQSGNIGPLKRRNVKTYKGIAAVAMNRQQTLAPLQVNAVQIPAQTPVGLCPTERRRYF